MNHLRSHSSHFTLFLTSQDLLRIVQSPSLSDFCVDLMASCEEVIGEALDIIAYWCGNESIQPTLADLPSQIYAVCFHTRLESAVLVLKYSEDERGNAQVWKELEQRDENEDNWTFDEEQSLIGQLGRWNASESCTLLAGVMNELLTQLKQQPNESVLNVLEEKLYWLMVFIDHFVADYDSTEIPLQFEAIQSSPDYPLLAFLDLCVPLSLFLSLIERIDPLSALHPVPLSLLHRPPVPSLLPGPLHPALPPLPAPSLPRHLHHHRHHALRRLPVRVHLRRSPQSRPASPRTQHRPPRRRRQSAGLAGARLVSHRFCAGMQGSRETAGTERHARQPMGVVHHHHPLQYAENGFFEAFR